MAGEPKVEIMTMRKWNKLRKTNILIQPMDVYAGRIYPVIIKLASGLCLAAIKDVKDGKVVVMTWTARREDFRHAANS